MRTCPTGVTLLCMLRTRGADYSCEIEGLASASLLVSVLKSESGAFVVNSTNEGSLAGPVSWFAYERASIVPVSLYNKDSRLIRPPQPPNRTRRRARPFLSTPIGYLSLDGARCDGRSDDPGFHFDMRELSRLRNCGKP